MASGLTREKRAHSYLRASMEHDYTNLPREHREAREQIMRAHERAYPQVREHALAGTDLDFDTPLLAGEREYQRHLREHEKLTERDIREMRSQLRDQLAGKPQTRASRARAEAHKRTVNDAARLALSGPRAVHNTTTGAIKAAVHERGSIFWRMVGGSLLLVLIYTAITGRGPKAITGIAGLLREAIGGWASPTVDPLKRLERRLGGNAAPSAAAASGTSTSTSTSPGATRGEVGVPGPAAASSAAERAAQARYAANGVAPAPQLAGERIHHRARQAARARGFQRGLRQYQHTHPPAAGTSWPGPAIGG